MAKNGLGFGTQCPNRLWVDTEEWGGGGGGGAGEGRIGLIQFQLPMIRLHWCAVSCIC